MAKAKQYCVYAAWQSDATGRDMAFGDGVTRSSLRLYAVVDTMEEAEKAREKFQRGKLLTSARVPGNEKLYPQLEVGEYNPLNFVGRQNRDGYTGKRYAALCGDLLEQAKRNAAELGGA